MQTIPGGWWPGTVVTHFIRSTKLLYAESS